MEQNWTTIIKPKNKLMDLKLKEIWQYRDLIMMFVKRDFKTLYKQTVLGPLWILITPLLTTFMQVLVFGGIANISTDGMPQFVYGRQYIMAILFKLFKQNGKYVCG